MLPGTRLSRSIAGLPPPPGTGSLDIGDLPISPRTIAVDQLAIGRSTDFALSAAGETAVISAMPIDAIETEAIDLALDVAVTDLPLPRVDTPEVAGALFFRERKVGTPAGARLNDARAEQRRGLARESSENLLSKLLPVLLPPASSEFAHVFVLPHDLYGFQLEGIKFLTSNKYGRLLADDMGLGKTVQAIVSMRHLFREGAMTRALVVAPKSVQTSWRRHLEEWAPELQVQPIEGSAQNRQRQWRVLTLNKAHVGVVTYASLRSDIELLHQHNFDLVVCDEIQNIKNSSTKQSQAVRSLSATRRWGLTGTPLENRIEEFATILNFLAPGSVPMQYPTESQVLTAAEQSMLRRRKDVIADQLPAFVRNIEYVELTSEQRGEYDKAERLGVARLRSQDVSVTNVLALITLLKQICNGVDGSSAKADWLQEYVDIAAEESDKAIVFSQYVRSLTDLGRRLNSHHPLTYTGGLSTAQRDAVVESFVSEPQHRVMLLSLRAGGTGLDRLQYAANRVVHFDSWWNPAVMDQATARVYRIGQSKNVFETTLVASDTVEDRIQQILEDKRDLFAHLVDDLSVQGLARVLDEGELFGLFGLKSPRRGVNAEAEQPREEGTGAGVAEWSREAHVLNAATVVSARTPYSNVAAIRRILRNARGTVWWFDPNFSRRALEELDDELDRQHVRAVRIMSRTLSPKDLRDFSRFRQEMQGQGIAAEWRISPEKLFHDRFLADDARCMNVPPVNLIYQAEAPYSEISPSTQRPPFEQWWALGKPPEAAETSV
jgi:superfamily II DNA or RNA helicase